MSICRRRGADRKPLQRPVSHSVAHRAIRVKAVARPSPVAAAGAVRRAVNCEAVRERSRFFARA
eukprot:5064799-Prymnesium_polylepis.1